jgi:outer membrane protein assembly factor BamE
VYVFYKAGKLAEQRRITLFFEGDTLARIEGDLPEPAASPVAEPQPVPPQTDSATSAAPAAAAPLAVGPAAQAEPPASEPVAQLQSGASEPAASRPVPTPAAAPAAQPASAPPAETSIVPPLPSPDNAPPYVDPRPSAELSLQPETDVARIQPDVMPPFPDAHPAAAGGDDPVLKAVNEWAAAWARHDGEAYLAAYDATYVPQGGGSRTDWEKRRRLLLGMAGDIDLRIDSPAVERTADSAATVTFNQLYRSANYRDAVVKQLRMIERDGRWLIIEEKVLSVLPGARP